MIGAGFSWPARRAVAFFESFEPARPDGVESVLAVRTGRRTVGRATRIGLLALALASTSLSSVRAQTWGGTGSTTTTSDYNLGTNWSNPPAGAPPVNAGQAATFSSAGSATVTVTAGPITPDSWTFSISSQSYIVSGQAVNFNGAGPNLVNNAFFGQTISISNDMTGTSISQAGFSTLTLSGTSTFTGTSVTDGMLVNNGTLNSSVTVTPNGVFKTTGAVSNGVNNTGTVQAQGVVNGAIVNSWGGAGAGFGAFDVTGTLTGNSTFTNSGTATLFVNGNFAGITTLTNNSTSATAVQVAATRMLSATSIVNNAGTFTNNGTVTTTAGFTNAAGATFTNGGAGSLATVNGGLTNVGTATNSSVIDVLTNTGGTFTNNGGGFITGASSVAGGSVSNSGHFAATMTVTGGTFNNNVFGDVAGATTNNGGTVNNAGTLAAVNNTSGTFNANGGSIQGAISNSGAFFVTASSLANSTFTNASSGSFTVGASYSIAQLLTNSGTIAVAAGAALGAAGGIANNAGTFTNNGTVSTIGIVPSFGITNAVGATFNNTGTLNGVLTNAGTVNAAGTINGAIINQTGGNFNVTGNLLANGPVIAGDGANFTVSGGDVTGISTFTNNAAGMIYFTQIDAGRSLTAADVVNNGNMIVSGTLNATNSFANAIGGNLVVDTTGRINGSVDAAGGYIQLYGTINGNLTLSGNLASMNSYGGSVSGRVDLAASGAQVYSTSGGATYGSLAGVAGTHADVGGFSLTVGGDNSDSTFAGSITGTGSFVKTGSGMMLLSGDSSTYTGTTTVNDGTLMVNGSLAASAVAVNNNGALSGSGALGAVQVNAGGLLAPGSLTPGTSMTLTSLAMQSGAAYLVFVDPTTSTFANVTGNASLGGATVGASFAPGSYVAKQYTILNAGHITGAFDPTVLSLGLPTGFHTSLSQDTNHVYLNLALNFAPPSGSLNGNQQKVGNAIINFFNTNGAIPMAFGALGPSGLTQLSGEVGSAPQQTTFGAMTQFMGVMTDPFAAGRDDAVPPGGASNAYAEESRAYARSERDAYAAISTKAPAAPSFAQRWSVWAAGFGGSQTTDGGTGTGSNSTTGSLYGTAVGADYRISRDTLVGFALAGGGTNFTVANNLGGGRSDLFQAGVYFRHIVGPAYISGALAYGWQDVITDRTVTVAGIDRLRAEFNANAYSGRLEGGYRFVTQGVGLTPYAAAQFTTFDLPAYAERAIIGSNMFALAYNAKSATDTRTELGLRTDKSFAAPDGIVTLRGRVAWAHDFNPDRAIGATFQTLPGASFVANGAAMAADAALVTGAVEKKWLNGWSATGTLDGEFSNVTRSYAAKGLVRYAW